MNAAFLLVTSAMLVGQGGGAGDKKPAPAPAPVASSCASSCDCDSGHRFRDRFRGFFNRDSCDTCKPATCAPACNNECRTPLFHSRCEEACRPKFWERPCRESCAAPTCAAPACGPTCHTHKTASCGCNDSCERGILTRLRERLQRDRCCDSGCGSACGTTTGPAPTKGEKIDVPAKKLPVNPGTDKKPVSNEVRFETPPVPFAVPVSPAVPSVEIVPVPTPAPRVDGARRDPF